MDKFKKGDIVYYLVGPQVYQRGIITVTPSSMIRLYFVSNVNFYKNDEVPINLKWRHETDLISEKKFLLKKALNLN